MNNQEPDRLKKPFLTQKPKCYEKENVKIPQVAEDQDRVPFNLPAQSSPGY